MKQVSVGIIGCGGIAQAKHIPNLLKNDKVKIIALADNRGCDYIQQVQEQFGLQQAAAYQDYQALLQNPDVEVVHVCTPNESHASITIEALAAGKHVLCEKPMASTLEQAEQMVAAAQQNGKKLSICANNRFIPSMWYLQDVCRKGELGDIYFAKAHCVRRRGVPTWGQFLDVNSQGGGPVIDLGTHALDLALWMMDNYKPRMVVGKTFDVIGKQGSPANPYGPWEPEEFTVEDSGFGMIVMQNGATIWLEATWALNTRDERPVSVTLCGSKAGADMTNGLIINTEEGGRLVDKNIVLNPNQIPFYQSKEVFGPELEIARWIDCILEDTQPVVLPQQMLVVAKIIDAIYLSNRTGKPVYFDEEGNAQ